MANPPPGSKQLKDEQKDIIREAWGKPRIVIVSPAGSGKTLTALSLFWYYRETGHKKKCLVFAHSKGWSAYPRDNQFGFRMKVIRTGDDMAMYLAHTQEFWDANDVIVVNTFLLSDAYAGLFPGEKPNTRRKVLRMDEAFCKTARFCDFVIFDEVHRYRTDDAKDTLALVQFFSLYKGFAVYMTATLFYTDLLNVFNIWRYIDARVFPSYWDFYEFFVDYEVVVFTMWMEGPFGRRYPVEKQRKEKIGYKNQDVLLKKIMPYLIVKMNQEFFVR